MVRNNFTKCIWKAPRRLVPRPGLVASVDAVAGGDADDDAGDSYMASALAMGGSALCFSADERDVEPAVPEAEAAEGIF